MISLGSPKKILRSPKKIGGSQRKSGVSNKFIWGLIWESATKIWGLNLKLGVSNDKFGLSNETVVMVGFYKAEALLLMLGFCKAEALYPLMLVSRARNFPNCSLFIVYIMHLRSRKAFDLFNN